MTVEQYSDKYKLDVEWLVQSFQEESLKEYGLELSLDVLSQTIEEIRPHIFLLIEEGKAVGILAGRPTTAPLSDELIWQEMVWFMLKEHRSKGVFLLNEVKRILKEQGFMSIIMVCMENSMRDKLFALYEKMGFQPMEHHFIGRL